MDFDKAVLNYMLGLFCLAGGIIGVLITIIFLFSGHIWPEGLVTLLISMAFFGGYTYIHRRK